MKILIFLCTSEPQEESRLPPWIKMLTELEFELVGLVAEIGGPTGPAFDLSGGGVSTSTAGPSDKSMKTSELPCFFVLSEVCIAKHRTKAGTFAPL